MPPKQRPPTELGKVVNYRGQYRAEVNTRNLGQAINIKGPRRGQNKKRASEDLASIRAAAHEKTTRMGFLQAMREESDRLKADAEHDTGGVISIDGEHRARFKFKDGAGLSREVLGPRRLDERRARADREAIQAAGNNEPTRTQALEAMQAEALDSLTVCYKICDRCVKRVYDTFATRFRDSLYNRRTDSKNMRHLRARSQLPQEGSSCTRNI